MKLLQYLPIIFITFIWSCSNNVKDTIDLSGEWNFQIDSLDIGVDKQWFNLNLPETIQLPGSMASNGKGDEISVNTHWTGGIMDKSWYTDERYAKYRQPGNIKVPFWLQPIKKYYGAAWYQKDVEIPEDWNNKSIMLFLERCHWETKVWVDSKYAGMQNYLGAPHEFDLTGLLTPGKHRISILVDNRIKDVDPGINSHSITDHTQSNWNGIVGDISLRSKPTINITDIRVYPDVENQSVTVTIEVNNPYKKAEKAELSLVAKSIGKVVSPVKPMKESISLLPGKKKYLFEYPMGKDVLLWDEFNPNLYTMNVELKTTDGVDKGEVQFGMRSFKTEGTRFTVNGRPVFLRGTLDCAAFPLTGYPPTDKKEWKRIFNVIKAHGLNHVRYHSWCPPESAFEVADEEGIYLQVECSSWANQGSSVGDGRPVDKWLYQEGKEIVRRYGNHPSFCMMAYGNEPAGRHQKEYLTKWVEYWKKIDKRRVYTSGAGWPVIPENDYQNSPRPRIQGWGQQLRSIINAEPPKTSYDWQNKTSNSGKPVVSHEIGQWCVYPDFKEIKEYSGVLKAKNFEIFQETLEDNYMGALADSFLLASGKLQALCYKADIEAALRTPGFAGFQLLGLSVFPGQGTALVGVLNVFWREKGYITPSEFRHFCNSTVPLARMSKRVFNSNENFTAEVEVSSFEEKLLKNVEPQWQITRPGNKVLWRGKFAKINIETNNCQYLGDLDIPLSAITSAEKLRLTVSVAAHSNSWDFWVYPFENKKIANEKVVKVVSKLDKNTVSFLQNGGRVILTPKKGSVKPEFGGDIGVGFSSIFWNTSWTGEQKPHTLGVLCDPSHPALAEFPTQYHSNWQWWDAMSHSNAIILDSLTPELKPIVRIIDDWFTNRRLALIFEVKVGDGKLIVSGVDLITNSSKRPEARQMLYSLKKYAASDSFNPKVELSVEQINQIFEFNN